MDRSELLAQQYLESLRVGPVRYEPDGNITPDFVVGGEVAVEVRRLNQNHEDGDTYQGLENAEAAIVSTLRKLLPTLGPAPDGSGYWVFAYFWRPLDWKNIKPKLARALKAFKADPVLGGHREWITESFELEIQSAGIEVPNYFMLGGYADRDQGGFVAAEIIRNLNLCIAEKSKKITPHRHRYPEWWLVLPDHIGADLNTEERLSIREHVSLGSFDRVILIHPREPTRALILKP